MVGVRRVFAAALAVALASVLVTASRPAEAAAVTIKVNVDRVDCGSLVLPEAKVVVEMVFDVSWNAPLVRQLTEVESTYTPALKS